jgi:hypothetical protein
MLAYSLKNTDEGNFVVEKDTGYEIPVSGNNVDAKKILRNLNMGGGFDGFTPTFFLWDGKIK